MSLTNLAVGTLASIGAVVVCGLATFYVLRALGVTPHEEPPPEPTDLAGRVDEAIGDVDVLLERLNGVADILARPARIGYIPLQTGGTPADRLASVRRLTICTDDWSCQTHAGRVVCDGSCCDQCNNPTEDAS